MKILNSKKLSVILLFSLLSLGTAFAQQNAETAARQARIDADKERVEIEKVEKRERGAVAVDGLESIELRGERVDRRMHERNLENAEAREIEAENEE